MRGRVAIRVQARAWDRMPTQDTMAPGKRPLRAAAPHPQGAACLLQPWIHAVPPLGAEALLMDAVCQAELCWGEK